MTGPSDVWFGVGFNATQMNDEPYTLLVNGSGVIEQKIGTCTDEGRHCPGAGALIAAGFTRVLTHGRRHTT